MWRPITTAASKATFKPGSRNTIPSAGEITRWMTATCMSRPSCQCKPDLTPNDPLLRLIRTMKSSVEEIRQYFDAEVDWYSNLETGQVGVVDPLLAMDLVTEAAAAVTPGARQLLDVG